MSAAYVVLALKEDNFIHTCELHAGRMSAFDRALEISKDFCENHLDWIDADPKEEAGDDDSVIWTFVETSCARVSVVYTSILTPAKQKINPFILDDTGVQVTLPPIKADDPADRDLPGGWNYSDKPVLMAVLDDDPYSVKMTSELTEAQKWALVTARINKRKAVSILIPGRGTYLKSAILPELNNKSPIGLQIRDAELDWLDQYLVAKRV